METTIVICAKCGARNRIHAHSDGLRPLCGRCKTPLTNEATEVGGIPFRQYALSHPAVFILLALLGGTICGILITPFLLKKDFAPVAAQEARKTANVRSQYEQQFAARRKALEAEVAAIDSAGLRRLATEQYNRELAGRKSYDKRFALSPREKAQLQMRSLASDTTKSLYDAIRAVAMEASPKGADISVRESSQGIALHIDFDMSSVTAGEQGVQTKHHTKESLRREVIALISRETNDIFLFCKDLQLESIHVGCRHHVKVTDQYGATRNENTLLYKIRVQKNRIQELASNPFLDVYSTTKYIEVDEDNFEGIEITTTKL